MTRTDAAGRARALGALATLALGAACSGGSGVPAPRPASVEPAVAFAATGASITIRGAGFFLDGVQSLDEGGSRVTPAFRAWAGDAALDDVRWVDEGTLRARVPAGLPPGRYDVAVENAFGRGAAPQALELLAGSPGAIGAAVTFPRVVAVGQEATVVVDVENRGGSPVLAATPALSGSDPARLPLVAGMAGPQDLAPGARFPFRWTFRATAPGDVAMAIDVAGTDGRTGWPVTTPGALPVTITVQRAATLGVSARADRLEVAVGEPVIVHVDVTNAGPGAVRDLALAPLAPAFLAAAGPAPAGRDLAAGETATFDLPFTAAQAGSGAVAVDVAAVDAGFGLPVATRASTGIVTARLAAVLAASAAAAPARVSAGQELRVTLSVEDRGGSAADVAPSVALSGTATLAPVGAAPGAARLEPGVPQAFVWTFRAVTPGDVTFAARVDGTDAVSGAPIAAAADAGPVIVQAPAFVTATAAATPEVVSVGQPIALAVTVTNTGGAAADVSAALALSGAASLSVASGPPTAPARLEPGETLTLRWAVATAGPGAGTLAAAVTATDANSGHATTAIGSAGVTVEAPARLEAELSADPDPANDGQRVRVRMRVRNLGVAPALDVAAPTALSLSGTGAAHLVAGPRPLAVAGASPASAVPGGGETWFEWDYDALVPGGVAWAGAAAARDGNGGWPATAPAATAAARVQRRAAFVAAPVVAPARVNVGQPFPVRVTVTNDGDAAVRAVVADVAATPGTPVTAGDPPAPAELPGGAAIERVRWFTGAAPGTASIGASVTGMDATDGRALSTAAAPAVVTVERPGALVATLALPTSVSAGELVVALTVENVGGAAVRDVAPGALAVLPATTAQVAMVAAPSGAVTVPGGQAATFEWRLRVDVTGALQVATSAVGVDANDGGPRAAAAESTIVPAARDWARVIATDPLGDGTRFAFVVGYGGGVYAGPSRAGTGIARVPVDGAPAQSIAVAFGRDTVGGNVHSSSATPYLSIGYTGCATNSLANACGPDNEDGRGLLASVTFQGTEWLVLGGARSGGDLDYVYLAKGDLSAPAFSYVDLSAALGGNTRGFSAAYASGARLYLGFPDNGGNRPYGLALLDAPTPPGLNAVKDVNVVDLGLQEAFKKALGPFASITMVDSIAELGGRLYFFSNVGCIVATSATPQSKDDFLGCSPAVSAAYDPKGSVEPVKQYDLEPRERAWPQAAVWKGRLYAIRNTYTGPQLWACDPAGGPSAAVCDPGDWALVAGDAAYRTRLGRPGATSASLLVATPRHLYVGLDDSSGEGGGVHLFRTAVDRPATAADFTGGDGCVAGTAGCAGIGGDGFGDPGTLIRIFDAKAISAADGTTDVYLTAGDGAAPVRVVRIGD